jgi:uncharacterized protein YprB with RNaseH-like and TPR domain
MRVENTFVGADGVGEATERRLWRAGATHWDAFDPDLLGPKRGERVRQYVSMARTHRDRGDARFFAETLPDGALWRCYENFRDRTCFLDIETTGLDADRHVVTCVTCHRGGETTTLVRPTGDDVLDAVPVGDAPLTADRLRSAIAGSALVSTFNGARFDLPFLESALGVSIDHPHLDLMYPCRRADLTGGLKAIESDLGIDRSADDLDGSDAVRLWREHEAGDERALETLVDYNRADTVNMETVADRVTDRLHERVFEAAIADA